MNQPHGFDAIHSRHEDIEKQQVEFSGLEYLKPLAAVGGDDDAVSGAFQQKPDGRLHGAVVVDDQDFCQGQPSANTMASMFGCESAGSAAQAFPDNVSAMVLKKSGVKEPSYARYGADGIGPRAAAHDSFHSGVLKDRARCKRGGPPRPCARRGRPAIKPDT